MYGLPWWKYLPQNFSPVFTKLIQHKDKLQERIGHIVDQSLAHEKNDSEEKLSILDNLISNPDIRLSDVKTTVVDYITAGVDTIGNSVLFTIALLALPENQACQVRLRTELETYADGEGNFPSDTIDKLVYLKACIQESFRLYPTASQLARILEKDLRVGHEPKYILPAGSLVLCHHRIASWQEENFTRASEFLPHRWLKEERDMNWNHQPGLVVPFGVGKRICPGKRLAEREMCVVIAKTFLNFRVEVVGGRLNADFNFLLVPSPDTEIRFREKS